MKMMMRCITFTSLSIIAIQISVAQWVQTNGPSGGQVDCFASYTAPSGNGATYIFAGTGAGGVLLSTDMGVSWRAVNNGLPYVETIRALAISPVLGIEGDATVYAGTEYHGIFRSTDNGSTWNAVTSFFSGELNAFAAFPASNESGVNIFAGTGGGGVFLSTNNGLSWTPVNTGLTDTYVNALAVNGTNLFAATGSGVFLSTNNGTSWTAVNTGFTNWLDSSVVALVVSGSHIIAGTEGGVFGSTDNGTSWRESDNGMRPSIIRSLAGRGTNVLAGTSSNGVFLSTNNGASWNAISTGLPVAIAPAYYWDLNAVAIIPTSDGVGIATFLAAPAGGQGVCRSTDNGTNWTATVFPNSTVGALAVTSSSEAAGSRSLLAGTGLGVFRSTDDGASWISSTGIPAISTTCFAVLGTEVIAGTEGNGIYRSTDQGTSWTELRSAQVSDVYRRIVRGLAVIPNGAGDTNVIAAIYEGIVGVGFSMILLSTDNGQTWSVTDSPGALSLGADGTNVFAGFNGIFLSTDCGTHWNRVDSVMNNVKCFASIGTNLFAGTLSGVFRSSDKGTSWTAAGLTNETVGALAIWGKNLFAGCENSVFCSTDNGASWTYANTGSANPRVESFAVSGPDIFVGTSGNGVWKRPLSEMVTGVVERITEVPSEFKLAQNYPNPFNPSTTIKFHMPKQSRVTLKIFDLLGREVASLVNENEQAGIHTVEWDASRLASGVYFYTITAGSCRETKRMILMK